MTEVNKYVSWSYQRQKLHGYINVYVTVLLKVTHRKYPDKHYAGERSLSCISVNNSTSHDTIADRLFSAILFFTCEIEMRSLNSS